MLTVIAAQPGAANAVEREPGTTRKPPNIVVILTDDQGLADYSAYGTSDIRTPNIDRVFREGQTWKNFYANSCVCSPTRAALLSGLYPDRAGVPGVIRDIPADSWGRLAPQVKLLPELLKPAGYHSTLVGKWHLGYAAPDTPLDRGFDSFHGFLGDMMDDYLTHVRHGRNFMRRDRDEIHPEGHATDLFSDWACATLRERAKSGSPFFLYLAYNAPHDPIQPPDKWLARVRERQPQLSPKRAGLVALIEHLDAGIGRVLGTLDELGLARDTIVVFTSDNGGLLTYEANNGPWRSGKTHMYEGGLRVPMAVRWPAKVAAGSTATRIGASMDLCPTLLAAAGLQPPPGLDGVNLLSTVEGDESSGPERELYFVRREGGLAYNGKTIEALRRGDWKLVLDSPYAPAELYHLGRDPGETSNLAAKEPKVLAELSAALRRHIQRGGEVPWQAARSE